MKSRSTNIILLGALAMAVLLLPVALLLRIERSPQSNERQILLKYIQALYARDFKQSYRFISSQDRELKTAEAYIKEQGAFTGFTAEVARKLAGWITLRPVQRQTDGDRIRVKVDLTLPDAGALAPLVSDWDEERLNKLLRKEQKKLLTALDKLKREGSLKMISGNEDYVLVKEGTTWKVFLDWAAGVRVIFDAAVPAGAGVEAWPVVRETVVHPGDLFTVEFRVKNQTPKEFSARIGHHVEPESLADHLDLVECALLFPVRIPPHREQTYESKYLLRGDLPQGAKQIKITYDFQLER